MMPVLLVGDHTLKIIVLENCLVPRKEEWSLRTCAEEAEITAFWFKIGQNRKNSRVL